MLKKEQLIFIFQISMEELIKIKRLYLFIIRVNCRLLRLSINFDIKVIYLLIISSDTAACVIDTSRAVD